MAGEYSVCFANEFSPDSKLVYIDVAASESKDTADKVLRHESGALTQMESTAT